MKADPDGFPVFIGSEIYRRPAFGGNHPLSISRQGAVVDIARALGWLTRENYVESPLAGIDQLTAFHSRDYVEALKAANERGGASAEDRTRYAFGTMENPLFPGVFDRAAASVGGSIRAAELALSGRAVFSPGGGTHHGRPDRASGFCYFNDPVFALLTLLEAGLVRVAYIDLDAHHGDGVESAFAGDRRVRLISIHEENRWPHSGGVEDRGGGSAFNAPVPAGFHDQELNSLLDGFLSPFLAEFRPQAIVVTCGADGLAGDPLSKMALTNIALQNAVMRLIEQTPAAVILGGGGYNPWTTVRCWVGLWGKMCGKKSPTALPDEIRRILSGFECDLVDDDDMRPEWLTTLDDEPSNEPVREPVKTLTRTLRRAAGLAD